MGCSVFRMEAESTNQKVAAQRYADLLPDSIDVVLLSVGEDGHIASLFPHTSILDNRKDLVAAVHVEDLDRQHNRQRISMTFPCIEQARHVLVIVAGIKKAQIINDILGADAADHDYPAQRIQHLSEWHIDNEAASLLPADYHTRINDYYDRNSGC